MSAPLFDSTGNSAGDGSPNGFTIDDPFVSSPAESTVPRESHRGYSSFDTQLFSLNAASPAQAKRALEAHLAETERRLHEASKLGTALIDQQRELEDKLKEVERQQDEGEIGPDLRHKLADLEREYNDIGRESARAFLAPKRMAAGGDEGPLGTPTADSKSPINPSLYASQATNSPSKVSVPSRKQRNQPSNRVHDIEFATEISTSLLAQVRSLQALLAEREESLKTINLEKSRLELEAEGYSQRIRALDESEERYKDENWALETRTHELMATIREATDRETKLNSNLSAINNDKGIVEREMEDLKQLNAKLAEDHTAAQKANDAEVHQLRRNLTAGDAEKFAMQQKLDELNAQNQELAKAVAMRLRQHDADSTRQVPQDNDSDGQDNETPDNSPPPSPNKFTPRHNHLETETLRSSLGHAHRMIQNLKSTIHREKTEKIELKRMLQDARDEVEQRRRESTAAGGPSSKRQKVKSESLRKPPRPDLLGAGRKGKAEIEGVEEEVDTEWEDKSTRSSPPQKTPSKAPVSRAGERPPDEPSDAYQTATEADGAFETANERDTTTESEAFQTGNESMADDSSDTDELTETEETVHQRTPRGQRVSSLMMAKARDRTSYYSSASTSASEGEDGYSSPIQAHTRPRHRLRMRRSVLRKVRPSGEAPMATNSRPSSARNSPSTSFVQEPAAPEGQSLFAELADLDGTEEEEGTDDNFGQSGSFEAVSQTSTPRMAPAPDSRRPSGATLEIPLKLTMVDSGMMTEPWDPVIRVANHVAASEPEEASTAPSTPTKTITVESEAPEGSKEIPRMVSSETQWTPLKSPSGPNADLQTPPKMAWDEHAPETGEGGQGVAAQEPVQLGWSSISTQETTPVASALPELSTSYIVGGTTEPVDLPAPQVPEIMYSSIYSQSTQPVLARLPELYVPEMLFSSIFSEATEPVVATLPEPERAVSLAEQGTSTDLPALSVSSILSEHTEPVLAKLPEPEAESEPAPVSLPVEDKTADAIPELVVSAINSQSTKPVPVQEELVKGGPKLSVSDVDFQLTKPVVPKEREVAIAEQGTSTDLPDLSAPSIVAEQTNPIVPELVAAEIPELAVSAINSQWTEPVAPKEREMPVVAVPDMSFSTISSVETTPVESVLRETGVPAADVSNENVPPSEDRSIVDGKPAPPALIMAEDDQSDDTSKNTSEQLPDGARPLSAISGNASRPADRRGKSNLAEQGAQTILSSKQIDQILMDRVSRPLSPPESDRAKEADASPFATPRAKPRPSHATSLPTGPRRPDSSASHGSSAHSHPPLSAEHREAISAAEKSEQRPASPSVMGPPLAPASAYRANTGASRPMTPHEQGVQTGSIRTNSSQFKARHDSHASRRSSISSFASEMEERFNMYPNGGGAMPNGYAEGTDPRMIQAITQTMIGEFLWKYTRKTASSDMSNTRHRRYFWVHPYTRTLYWSEHDPQHSGKTELRTKSVPIEAVRVVADDNPYPPGLHCRSLEVISPGRRVRFTATTSQRHETWFNALSYLLLRNSEEYEEPESSITLEDIDEFNPGFRSNSHQTQRMSFSSSQSRTLRNNNPPKQRAGSTMSMRHSTVATPGRASPALSAPPQSSNSPFLVPDQNRQGSSSRLSTIFNTTIRGTFGHKGRHGHSTSSIHSGIDDFRAATEREEPEREGREMDGIENVRACCDGKHDVGSLSRTSRYSPRVNRIHSHH